MIWHHLASGPVQLSHSSQDAELSATWDQDRSSQRQRKQKGQLSLFLSPIQRTSDPISESLLSFCICHNQALFSSKSKHLSFSGGLYFLLAYLEEADACVWDCERMIHGSWRANIRNSENQLRLDRLKAVDALKDVWRRKPELLPSKTCPWARHLSPNCRKILRHTTLESSQILLLATQTHTHTYTVCTVFILVFIVSPLYGVHTYHRDLSKYSKAWPWPPGIKYGQIIQITLSLLLVKPFVVSVYSLPLSRYRSSSACSSH